MRTVCGTSNGFSMGQGRGRYFTLPGPLADQTDQTSRHVSGKQAHPAELSMIWTAKRLVWDAVSDWMVVEQSGTGFF